MPAVKPNVKLLRYTEDPEEIVAMAGKLCYSAATLDDLEEKIQSKDQSKYLSKMTGVGHFSPFEHASFTFGIEGVSRSLLAQLTRHRLASFSVQSQRYVTMSDENSEFDYIIPPRIEEMGEECRAEYHRQMTEINKWYLFWREKLGGGRDSNEDARFVLPNASSTRIIFTMNTRELIHFLELRCCNRAQWEIREIAWKMLELVYPIAPKLFGRAGAGCVNGSCPEKSMSCGKMQEVAEKHRQMIQRLEGLSNEAEDK